MKVDNNRYLWDSQKELYEEAGLLRSRELEMKARLVGPVGVGAVPYVTQEDIEAVVSMWTGIPVEHMLQDERDRLQRLPQALKVQAAGPRSIIHSQSLTLIALAVSTALADLQYLQRSKAYSTCSAWSLQHLQCSNVLQFQKHCIALRTSCMTGGDSGPRQGLGKI